MDKNSLYLQIASHFHQAILEGKYKPGDRLPSVRDLTSEWHCTPGTIQHAYQELSHQGLVVSRPGQGTLVVSRPAAESDTPIRRASLIHRAESFLLEALNNGHSVSEIETAVQIALDRWRKVEKQPAQPPPNTLRFIGSHDLAITWIAGHFEEIVPGYELQLAFTGSLGGLRKLAEGEADLAGSHLWDQESKEYNSPYIHKLFPNQPMVLLTLAHRRLGLILPVGNPFGIRTLADLVNPNIQFINRQTGSGTRVWLDAQLQSLGIDPKEIKGAQNEKTTHTEVAQVIAEGGANAGIGLEASARQFGLDFIFLTRERYDLIFEQKNINKKEFETLITWLNTSKGKAGLANFPAMTPQKQGESD